MPKKTNKTSHVMDLLTNGASGESNEPDNSSAAAEDSAAAAEKKNNVQSTTVTPSKVTVVDEASRNDRLSQEILNNLSEELQKETGQAPAAEASNKTMSPDEIAAAFAAAQAPQTSTAPAAPAPEASNKTMSPDEIAAAFAAAQAPETSPAPAAPEASVTPPAPAPQPAAPAQPAKPTPRSIIPKSQISENLTDDQ